MAEDYTAQNHSVTKPQVDQLDAGVLLIHFPGDGPAMLDDDELEDPCCREVNVIRGKHYAVLNDNAFAAPTNLSPLTCD